MFRRDCVVRDTQPVDDRTGLSTITCLVMAIMQGVTIWVSRLAGTPSQNWLGMNWYLWNEAHVQFQLQSTTLLSSRVTPLLSHLDHN